ncbi:MAG: hypothetical protein QXQ40_02060 [Candidatus Aenigmatarchaeota archaeon]
MKGVSFAVIAIIALLGVLGVISYSVYQFSYGGYGVAQPKSAEEDISRTKLELTKTALSQNLKFASHQAMITAGAQGGTAYPTTYWWCNSQPQPPSPNEFAFVLSNFSLNNFNAYINAYKEDKTIRQMNITVEDYRCININNPGKENCLGRDSRYCEWFRAGTVGGSNIEVHSPSYKSYFGEIEGTMDSNRGYWLYWNLYDAAKNKNLLIRVITQSFQERCPGPEDPLTKLKIAIEDVCPAFEKLFDEYVKCSYEILCLGEGASCLNTPCERDPLDKLCSEGGGFMPSETIKRKPEGISLQRGTASARIKFIFTDYKYNIPSNVGMIPLKFIMMASLEAGEQECRPID